jgi:hypothetical protein
VTTDENSSDRDRLANGSSLRVCAALVLRSACLIAFSLNDAVVSAAAVGEVASPRVSFCRMWLRLSQELEELIASQASLCDYFEQRPSLYLILGTGTERPSLTGMIETGRAQARDFRRGVRDPLQFKMQKRITNPAGDGSK